MKAERSMLHRPLLLFDVSLYGLCASTVTNEDNTVRFCPKTFALQLLVVLVLPDLAYCLLSCLCLLAPLLRASHATSVLTTPECPS